MTPEDLARAERELVLALNPGPESDRDIRLADWALWWGPRLLESIRHKEPQIDSRPDPMSQVLG